MASRYSFSEQSFVGFFQMSGELGVHFFLLSGVECEAAEALADKFLPIRHRSPR